MSPLAAGVFFALYLMTEVGITRIRAEVGSPIHDLYFAGPEYLMVNAVGTRKLGPRNLSVLSFFWFLTRAHYSDVMPHQLEGFRLADQARMNNRRVLAAMLIATVVGTVVAFWAILDSVSAQWRHHDVGRSGAIHAFTRVVNLSHINGYAEIGILCIWVAVRSLPDGHAMAISLVAFSSGRLCCIQFLSYGGRVVYVLFGVAD